MELSERSSSELALRDLEQRHRQILDAITDWVLVKGPDSRIVWANKAFREVYGMTNEQLQGMVDAPFSAPDYTQQYVLDDAQVFRTGVTLDIPDEPVTRHDGLVLHVHTVKSPIFDGSGKVVMTVGVSRDITERKRLEAQLMFSDRMASVGTLAAGVAHEINNPLAYVMSNLDSMAEEVQIHEGDFEKLRGTLRELVNQARDGAERVRKIVRGLSTFSRADEERRVPLQLGPVLDLSINMAWNEVRHRARVVKDFGPVPPVDADETRLVQVFINLLVNAAHALPEGNADANRIRLSTSTDSEGRAVVEVADTGGGIPAAIIGRIFDPFFTTKAVGAGTGLGLSICHTIVTGLGGTITVQSEEGSGTTFRITLPASVPLRAAAVPTPPAPAERARRRGRVLIVDDDQMVGLALCRTLEREHEVVVLQEGRAALALFTAGERFDVVFCDLMMPVLTGMELYAELMTVAPAQVERLVLMTGGAFTAQAREFLDRVPNERMEKPFDNRNVRAVARRLVG